MSDDDDVILERIRSSTSAAGLLAVWFEFDVERVEPIEPMRLASGAALEVTAGDNAGGSYFRHRLNRGGDRLLNRAIHTIARSRRRNHPATQDYVTRRTGQGRTSNEINRCLKRYLARQLFRIMEAAVSGPACLCG